MKCNLLPLCYHYMISGCCYRAISSALDMFHRVCPLQSGKLKSAESSLHAVGLFFKKVKVYRLKSPPRGH